MKTTHQVIFADSKRMTGVDSESVDLIVTSPPYPMIEMWDDLFISQNQAIGKAFTEGHGASAFELMHKELEGVWDEVYRVLKKGGIACINIGDATRTVGGNFVLYQNHSRIMSYMLEKGFSALPAILWRKQTNAPNKFMGSGMMPPGAYVTLEHEFVLILRKGSFREFKKPKEKQIRRESAFFWEERNIWFSDIWFDLKGTGQELNNDKTRLRSGAYPFELSYRLVNMFSVKGDMVLDPFLGTGTTTLASMVSGRNSIGFEVEPDFEDMIKSQIQMVMPLSNEYMKSRIKRHVGFVEDRVGSKAGFKFKYKNKHYGFPVMTSQEQEILFNELLAVEETKDNTFKVTYSEKPQEGFCGHWDDLISSEGAKKPATKRRPRDATNKSAQLTLLDNQ
jgi:DNA modification methylase